MIVEIERFAAAASGSAELQSGMKSLTTPDSLVAYANQHGFDFSAQELQGWAELKSGELQDKDLENVAGGSSDYMARSMAAGNTFLQTLYYKMVVNPDA